MAGATAVSIAFLLGCIGPKFVWRGAAWLFLSTLVIGSAATAELAYQMPAEGALFVITPWSVLVGLSEQLLLGSACYISGTVFSIGVRRLRGLRLRPANAAVPPKIER